MRSWLTFQYLMLGTLREHLVSSNLKTPCRWDATTKCSHRTALSEVATFTHHSKPGLTFKIADGKFWTYADVSCHFQKGGQAIGVGVYHPSTGNSSLVEPNGSSVFNTTGRAELAAKAAAIAHCHNHITADSLISLHQIRKQFLYPEKHRHHVQGDILKVLSNTIRNSQSHVFL